MEIVFSKENIEQIRRLIRREIEKFWINASRDLHKQIEEDEMKEFT